MQIEKKFQIELAVSNEESRKVITNVNLQTVNGKKSAVATNGRMLAVVPTEYDESEAGYVTPECLKLARKVAGRLPMATVNCNGDLKLTDGRSFPRPKVDGENSIGTYPNIEQVIPAPDRPVAFEIALDAKLLYTLAKAIGAENDRSTGVIVKLKFAPNVDSPIVVSTSGGGFGVLMPGRLT